MNECSGMHGSWAPVPLIVKVKEPFVVASRCPRIPISPAPPRLRFLPRGTNPATPESDFTPAPTEIGACHWMNVLQLAVAVPFLTIEFLWAGTSAGVRRTPHEVTAAATPGHVLWGAWSQESVGKRSQGITPGAGGSIDGAAINPCCHMIQLKWIMGRSKTQQVHYKSLTVYCD